MSTGSCKGDSPMRLLNGGGAVVGVMSRKGEREWPSDLSAGNRNPTEMPFPLSLCIGFPINFLKHLHCMRGKVAQNTRPWVSQETLRRAAPAPGGRWGGRWSPFAGIACGPVCAGMAELQLGSLGSVTEVTKPPSFQSWLPVWLSWAGQA